MRVVEPIRRDPARAVAVVVLPVLLSVYLRIFNPSPSICLAAGIGLFALLVGIWARESAVFGPDSAKPKPKKETFDWGMHYMRGFAIFCIMFLHFPIYLGHPKIPRSFFGASTVFFLFISGYLCQYLALKKPVVDRDYYTKKLQNVICPYAIWTVLTVLLVAATGNLRAGIVPPGANSLRDLFDLLLLGNAQNPYWYIPFVTVLFAVSPALTRAPLRRVVWLTVIAFGFSIVFPSRETPHLAYNLRIVFAKYTYFSCYYFLGFVYARLKDKIDPYLKSYAIPALFLAFVLGIEKMHPGFFHIPVLKLEVFKSLQKGLFLVPVLIAADWLKHRKIRILDMFAELSFTLFFIHFFFIQDFINLKAAMSGRLPEWILFPSLLVMFYAQCLVLSAILKKALGRWSRPFIGA
jgi:hypothetical protein